MAEKPIKSPTSAETSFSIPDLSKEDAMNQIIRADPNHTLDSEEGKSLKNNDLEKLEKTKSIAETLSLPHEILFVSIICLAQITARKFSRNLVIKLQTDYL